MQENEGKVRLSGYSKTSVTLGGLKDDESDLIQAAVHGHQWVTVKEGRLSAVPAHNPLPDPVEDPEMLPFWRKRQPGSAEMQEVLLDTDELRDHSSPSIYISSLCGYFYTPERYKDEANRLQDWGFVSMRSQRGTDGRYWEVWYLCGIWAAKNELKEAIETGKKQTNKAKLERALDFLRRSSAFGSLDVSIQKLAMPVPD